MFSRKASWTTSPGVGKLKGRLVILLDLNRILQRGELQRLGTSRGTLSPNPSEQRAT